MLSSGIIFLQSEELPLVFPFLISIFLKYDWGVSHGFLSLVGSELQFLFFSPPLDHSVAQPFGHCLWISRCFQEESCSWLGLPLHSSLLGRSLPLKSSLPLYFPQCLHPDVLLIFWPAILFFWEVLSATRWSVVMRIGKFAWLFFDFVPLTDGWGMFVCVALRKCYQYCLHTPLLWMHT